MTLTQEQRIEQITKIYRYLQPTSVSFLKYDHATKKYSAETRAYTPDEEKFVSAVLEQNKKGFCCYVSRNRLKIERQNGQVLLERNKETVEFTKCIVVDIDNDFDDTRSKSFEELAQRYQLHIDAKIRSRAAGGYHYYIPYKPTEVNDTNREQMQQLSINFKDWLLENNIEVDRKIFDLARLIRVWGSFNNKQKSDCEIVSFAPATAEQIESNTLFINAIPKKQIIEYANATFGGWCDLMEYCRTHVLPKEGVHKNDILLKNAAVYYWQLNKDAGFGAGIELTERQNHHQGEFDGWWKKVKSGELTTFNCGELKIWLTENFPERLPESCAKCRLLSKNRVEHLNTGESFHELKFKMQQYKKLLVSSEVCLKGMVTPSVYQYQQELIVYRMFEKTGEDGEIQEVKVIFFDEKQPSGATWHEVPASGLTVNLFLYNFITEGKEILLMSDKQIEFGESFLSGTTVKLSDKFDAGNYATLISKRDVILMNTAYTSVQKINNVTELFTKVPELNFDKLCECLFAYRRHKDKKLIYYQQPDYVAKMILAVLFSYDDEFPLHFGILGKPGGGKSTVLEAVFSGFNEPIKPVDGGGSSFKGIIPSFAGHIPKLGALLECRRLCLIEEFLRLIKSEEAREQLALMNTLLLHNEASFKTGKGEISARMSARLLFDSNPIPGKNFEETLSVLPREALDRILFFKQDEFHRNWVGSREHMIELRDTAMSKYDLVSIYDFFNSTSITTKFDKARIRNITEENRVQAPSFMIDLYDSRYTRHHAPCLMDGIIKLRCLLEQDPNFTATEKDYTEFEEMWKAIVMSWFDHFSREEAERLLTPEQNAIIEFLDKQGEIWDYQLKKHCEERNIDFKLNYKHLLNLHVIEANNRKISVVKEEEINLSDI